MAGTPLLIGEPERHLLHGLRELATDHPVDITGLLERLKQPQEKRRHMKQMSKQTVYLPAAYAVTFSIETNHPTVYLPAAYAVTFSIETNHPIGTCRHMSMSVDREGRVPNEHAVWMIAQELGFWGDLSLCAIWLEDLKGHGKAVNLVQPLNDALQPTR